MRIGVIYLLLFFVLLFSSCGKGYQIRFANYYTESMDSVVIGKNKIVFENVKQEATTDFANISRGSYNVTFITKTKKKFYYEFFIPGTGTGKRTLQIDGTKQIDLLQE